MLVLAGPNSRKILSQLTSQNLHNNDFPWLKGKEILINKTSVRAGAWNIFSGVFDPAVVTEYLGAWNISAGVDNSQTLRASGTDVAANPSQSAPGRLTYQDGNPDPVNKSYPARYNW